MTNRRPAPQNASRRRSRRPSREDYEALAEFRYQIRCFLEFSKNAAREVGLTARQHQALLAIKGWASARNMTIGDLAERLRIRHHSAAELVDRLCEAGLTLREHDPSDQRRVLLSLTVLADERLGALSLAHLDELRRLAPILARLQALAERS